MEQSAFTLFDGVSDEARRSMIECFRGREQAFPAAAVLADYGEESGEIGVLLSGRADVIRTGAEGERTILEHLSEGEPFGRTLCMSGSMGDCVLVVAAESCRVLFLDYDRILSRCANACPHHALLEQNMIRIVTNKVRRLSERVEVLSRRTIREKLLCYFALQRGLCGDSFQLPFSLSRLADYISADRSAMMRELKKLKEEKLVAIDRRRVTLGRATPCTGEQICRKG